MRRGAHRSPREASPAPTAGDQDVILIGRVAARLSAVDAACNHCGRRGRLHTARLVAEHGAGIPVPTLLRIVADDLPRMQAA